MLKIPLEAPAFILTKRSQSLFSDGRAERSNGAWQHRWCLAVIYLGPRRPALIHPFLNESPTALTTSTERILAFVW